MKVKGRVIVVTGGGNGIGREVVLELLRRGAWVAAADIRPESLAETESLAGVGDRLATFALDITDRTATQALPSLVNQAVGAVDGVVNVAGIIQPFVPINDLSYEAIDRVIDVNLYGSIHMIKAFLPILLQRPEAHIVNVSSMGGFLPVPGQSIYGATKAAVKLMSEGLYAELLDTEVGVTVVMPGAVATEISQNSGVSIEVDSEQESSFPTTSPGEAAAIIVDGMEADRLHVYVGRDSLMMSLLNRAAPKQSTHLIRRQMKDLLEM